MELILLIPIYLLIVSTIKLKDSEFLYSNIMVFRVIYLLLILLSINQLDITLVLFLIFGYLVCFSEELPFEELNKNIREDR